MKLPRSNQIPPVPEDATGGARNELEVKRWEATSALQEVETLEKILKQSRTEATQFVQRYMRLYEEHGGQLKLDVE